MKLKRPKFWSYKKPNLFAIVLYPVSICIQILSFIKNKINKKNKFKIKTICFGNFYVGGTGKTSLCIKLNNVDIYVVDTFGETKKFHNLGSTVFLGGSIIKRGGQNPLEAARCGSQILHGPYVDNFKDVYKLLNSLKASKKINSSDKLASFIRFKKTTNIGNKIKFIGEKILKKTIKELNIIISNET